MPARAISPGLGARPGRTLDIVAADGFASRSTGNEITTLALASLRVSLKSWWSTYQDIAHSSWQLVGANAEASLREGDHGWNYFVSQSEAIVHLQHFAELVCKDMLRSEHELLATVASGDPVVLHRLLKGESPSEEDLAKQRSIEFAEALDVLVKLIAAGRLSRTELSFVREHEQALRRLNTLRNRLWHRGTFTLRYDALDELMGRFLLPFVEKVVALPEYAHAAHVWLPRKLACGLDPLVELRRELDKPNWSRARVAYLKELGRAAYENPIENSFFSDFNDDRTTEKAMNAARRRQRPPYDVAECPCCGVSALVSVEESDIDEESGQVLYRLWTAECECCTFVVPSDLGNGRDIGLAIPDLFPPTTSLPCDPS